MAKYDTTAFVTQAVFLVNPAYEILILQLPDFRWQLPGGKLQCKEHWKKGITRELFEETSLTDIQIVRPLYVDSWHTPTRDYYRTYFLCTTIQVNIALSRDHIAYKWINKNTDLRTFSFTHDTVRTHIRQFFKEVDQ